MAATDPFMRESQLGEKGYHNLCGLVGINLDKIEQRLEG